MKQKTESSKVTISIVVERSDIFDVTKETPLCMSEDGIDTLSATSSVQNDCVKNEENVRGAEEKKPRSHANIQSAKDCGFSSESKYSYDPTDCLYICSQCEAKFKTGQGISVHVKACTKMKCNLCEARFKDKKELQEHQDSHYENNTFKCLLCDYISAGWAQVKIHMETHNNPDTHKCPDCEISFASSAALKNHRRFQHLGGKHICDECGLEVGSKYQLFQHKMHIHSLAFICPHCPYSCDNQIDLDAHVSSRHKNGLACKYCAPPTVHSTQDDLAAHITEMHPGKKCFLCDSCNYVAKLRHHLEKHNLVHTGERPLKCDVPGCDFSAKDRRNLKQHVIVKHSKPGDLICRDCSFVTQSQNELDVHKSMYHMKVFQCEHCSYKTKSRACLRRHRLGKHVSHENMRYPCPHCSYRANFRESLNKHLLTHTLRNSRHRCIMCKKCFKSREELKGHLHEAHPKKASQVLFCNTCPYSCIRSQVLNEHILTHSDKKDHKCDLCTYSARTPATLKAHVMRKHPGGKDTHEEMDYSKDSIAINEPCESIVTETSLTTIHSDEEAPNKKENSNVSSVSETYLLVPEIQKGETFSTFVEESNPPHPKVDGLTMLSAAVFANENRNFSLGENSFTSEQLDTDQAQDIIQPMQTEQTYAQSNSNLPDDISIQECGVENTNVNCQQTNQIVCGFPPITLPQSKIHSLPKQK